MFFLFSSRLKTPSLFIYTKMIIHLTWLGLRVGFILLLKMKITEQTFAIELFLNAAG